MRTRTALTIALSGLALALNACASNAPVAAPPAAPPPLSEEEMMAAMMRLAAVGEGHAFLEELAGEWRADGRFWTAPGAPVMESAGTMTSRLIMDGRFLLSDYRADTAMGPFEGMGLLGFDNSRQQYVGTWADSWSTMILPLSFGTLNDAGTKLTMIRELEDPIEGGRIRVRDTTEILSEDEHRFRIFEQRAGEAERLTLEVVYTRGP